MIKLSTRTRIALVSIVLGILYGLFSNIDISSYLGLNVSTKIDFLKAVILGAVLYLGTAWALFFKVRGERFITILLYPVLGTTALSLLVEIIVVNTISGFVGQAAIIVVSSVIIGFFSYICLLTVNILNTSHNENIPLAQAGRAAMFIISLIDAYLVFFMVYSNDLNIIIRLAIVAGISGILVYITLWSIQLRIKDRIYVTFAIALLLSFVAGILSIWPMQAPYLALVLSLFFYIFMNIAMEIREIMGKWIWIEYLSLFGLIAILLLYLSEWGINGPLF
jgi:hypothetical protein